MSTPPVRKADSSASPAVPPPSDPSHPTAALGEGGTQWQPRPMGATPTTADGIQVPGYEIQGELGRGGMGVVYLATHVLMKRPEVLKVVNKALLDGSPDMAERFLREIQAAARLDHENVVKAHSALRVGDLLVFAMEYVEGEDLAKLVRRQGPLPVAHACHYVSQAAMGLQHAHEKGMVHRDIKPHNLILTRRGKRHVVKILDFGLAKAVRGEETVTYLTASGAVLGTPAFMAPEQAQDAASADIRTDIYSLGCTLYFLLTGAPPFAGNSYFALMKAHESAEAPSLSQLRAAAPAELAAVAAKMLAKAPARRYQQPIEVAKALAPIIKATAQSPPKEKPSAPPLAKAVGPLLVSPSLWDKPTVPPVLTPVLTPRPPREAETATVVPPPRPRPPSRPAHKTPIRLLGGVVAVLVLFAVCAGGASLFFLPRWITTGNPQLPGLPSTWAPPSLLDCNNGVGAADVKRAQAAWAKYLGRQVDEEDEIAPGVTMKFVLVPPGKFQMGSPKGEQDRSDDEVQHEVELTRPFYLAVNDVTQAQYEAVTGENPSKFKGSDLPVETVRATEADDFARKLTERAKSGLSYRLPTEAEWEYSCRGGHPSSLPFGIGDGTSLSSLQANFNGTHPYGGAAPGPDLEKTTPVGTYEANALGLYDMQGNVWQWCADNYGDYPMEKVTDPKGPATGLSRVLRGGGWGDYAGYCRAAFRSRGTPGFRYNVLGFRLARVPSGLDK